MSTSSRYFNIQLSSYTTVCMVDESEVFMYMSFYDMRDSSLFFYLFMKMFSDYDQISMRGAGCIRQPLSDVGCVRST